ncbi:MAG: DNA repair protein RadA [Lachnospiraceae bacterium]|nr:DNA repair protein RadA [Lachnospiraceae bacterium]
MAKAKSKTVFFCQNCGYESAKWMGQCPGCHEWNTMVEEPAALGSAGGASASGRQIREYKKPVTLAAVSMSQEDKFFSKIGELDRVLGGGILPGQLVLVGGDPGIGKSTLLLQMCQKLSAQDCRVLYVSGEESLKQIKIRAQRMGEFTDSLTLLCETDLAMIETAIEREDPQVVVIDSIQTMFCESASSAPGSVSQVREATGILLRIAKSKGVAIFIVGHVTKEGTVAGPRVLEHMVDTVLYFEGDRYASYRILRAVKNRFGSTNEIGVFEMCREGLAEVKNPSEYMLSGRPQNAAGSVVVCAMEGTRPVLIELQALVCDTSFQLPRRQATGIDYNRVNLLMAVLEKRLSLHLGSMDAYVNLAGGMKVAEPALDLGVVLALISSYKNKPIPDKAVAFGEVGLSGEVRAVTQMSQRIAEAAKLGFELCVLPKAGTDKLGKVPGNMRLVRIENVSQILEWV